MRRSGKLVYVAVISALASVSAPSIGGTEIFRDDFSGGGLDTSLWNIGTWQLGRTRLIFTPQVTDGIVRLRHDTYNPSNPGGSFRGSEIWSDQRFIRGSGLEFEARVRVNALPNGLVTSFFTYQAFPSGGQTFADEIDFEFLSKHINAAAPGVNPVLATTWNDYNTNGSNFNDPNVHSSQNINVPGLNLAEFNTVKIRWLPDRVQWYVNDVPIRTAKMAVPDIPAPIRANFWAPGTDWQDAYAASLQPVNSAAQNTTHLYDIDYIAVRTMFDPVGAGGPNRVFTDRFQNGSVANSDTIPGFWAQRNLGSSGVVEAAGEPLQLTAAGSGYPHAQVVSGVREEFNFFESPIQIEATGIGFRSPSNSYGKSILRFVLSSQTLESGTQSEYTAEDAFSIRIQGDNRVTLGFKVNSTNTNSEYNQNLLDQPLSGPVRGVKLTVHPTFYKLLVEHDLSETDSTQTISEFNGVLNLSLDDWKTIAQSVATGDSSLFVQSQLNNSGSGESVTALLRSHAVNAVRPTWDVNAGGDWNDAGNWTADGVPNYAGANAQFHGAITQPQTITLSAPVTAGRLSFDSPHSYTIAGDATLTLDTPARQARIEVLGGDHTIAAPVLLQKDTTISVIPPAGRLTLAGDVAGAAGASLTKIGDGTLRAKHVRLDGSLAVDAGRLQILPGGGESGTSRVTSLAIAAGAAVDLADHDLVVDYTGTSPLSEIKALITSGYNAGDWLGDGLTSSAAADAASGGTIRTALAYAEASALGVGSFSGQAVDSTAVLVRYTASGDANLDGIVNLADFNALAANFGAGGVLWHQGDFNYDGIVNLADFNLLAANFGLSASGPDVTPADWAALASVVPEPGGIGWITAAFAAAMLKRHRRR